MAINYTWTVKALSKTTGNNLEDVIVQTRWECTGTDSADNISGTFVGATPFKIDSVDPENFTPYSELTEEIVLGWIKSVVKDNTNTSYWDHITERIQKSINDKRGVVKNVDEFDLPWSEVSGSNSGSIAI